MKYDGGDKFLSAVVPLLKLLTLALICLILAHPSTRMVPRATFRLLSKLVFAIFLPCLIFVQLGQSITLSSLSQWWFIPVIVTISTLAVAVISRPPTRFFRFAVIATVFGNTGNLLLSIAAFICHATITSTPRIYLQTTGNAYVSFSQWAAVLLSNTFVYHMMEPQIEYYEFVSTTGGDDNIFPPPLQPVKSAAVAAIRFCTRPSVRGWRIKATGHAAF